MPTQVKSAIGNVLPTRNEASLKRKVIQPADTSLSPAQIELPPSPKAHTEHTGDAYEPHVIPQIITQDLRSEDPSTVKDALTGLIAFCSDYNHYQEEDVELAFVLGLHCALFQTMETWQKHDEVLATACFCVQMYSRVSGAGAEALLELGIVDIIVGALKRFPKERCVQYAGVLALGNLLTGNNSRKLVFQRASSHFVLDLEGLAVVLKTMKGSPNQPSIQEACCGLLYNLALNAEYRNMMPKRGIVSGVAVALEKHHHHPGVLISATRFMKKLFAGATTTHETSEPQWDGPTGDKASLPNKKTLDVRAARAKWIIERQ